VELFYILSSRCSPAVFRGLGGHSEILYFCQANIVHIRSSAEKRGNRWRLLQRCSDTLIYTIICYRVRVFHGPRESRLVGIHDVHIIYNNIIVYKYNCFSSSSVDHFMTSSAGWPFRGCTRTIAQPIIRVLERDGFIFYSDSKSAHCTDITTSYIIANWNPALVAMCIRTWYIATPLYIYTSYMRE